ncbi:hypothetical protein, partial [Streptococcus thoraltensis]
MKKVFEKNKKNLLTFKGTVDRIKKLSRKRQCKTFENWIKKPNVRVTKVTCQKEKTSERHT